MSVTTRLGYTRRNDRHSLALHESGHLVMLWLHDRYAYACGISEGVGATRQLIYPVESPCSPHEQILLMLSGMIAENASGLLSDLRNNIAHPERLRCGNRCLPCSFRCGVHASPQRAFVGRIHKMLLHVEYFHASEPPLYIVFHILGTFNFSPLHLEDADA